MISECSLQVRSYECDSYNHVNNANYLNYLEYARHEFMKDVGFDLKTLTQAGYGVYVTRIEIDYKMPAFLDDVLIIKSWSIKKGAASGIISQEVRRDNDLLAAANVKWAFVDRKGQLVKIPPEWDMPGLQPHNPQVHQEEAVTHR